MAHTDQQAVIQEAVTNRYWREELARELLFAGSNAGAERAAIVYTAALDESNRLGMVVDRTVTTSRRCRGR